MINIPPLLVDEREAARLLGVSPRTMWQLNHDGVIPEIRVGKGGKRYSVATLRAWVESQERQK